jgi:vancomycin resistance protein YoaR
MVEVVVDHQILALDQLQVEMSKSRAEKMIDKKLTLNYEYQKIELIDKDLINFLALPDGTDQKKLNTFIDDLKKQIDHPSSDASLAYDKETLKVTEFTPDKNGLEVDSTALKKIIEDFLSATESGTKINNNFALPMKNTPAATSLEKTNDLGIKEVIGFGESWYDHSIPNRVYNVDIATNHITNQIVKPGEEFSFNKAIGEVSDRTGYRNAYIIEGGQTKLAPGGGVCQVSSTLFRSLLNAGVKITRRLPHAYRVSYYEIGNEPGFDATVYSGETDLRFMNDTPAHVLISCQSSSEELYMSCKLYGTSDGRSTEIINYKKWGATGPLPTVYIPDASLRPGQLKQIDWAAGGIKSEFTNVIRDKNGEIIREDYYKSNYRSWAAKYLKGV